jgi:hypothetical protein
MSSGERRLTQLSSSLLSELSSMDRLRVDTILSTGETRCGRTTMCSSVRFGSRGRLIVALVGLFIAIGCLGLFMSDYLQTRSEARLAVILARLVPGTPLSSYVKEFGDPTHHFVDVPTMKSWGPSTDDALLSKTELYYFWFSGVPFRYIVVYVDKNNARSVLVTWTSM